jgi:Fe-S-cluster containining protein
MAAEYLALVMKVESFVAQVGARRASDLACKKGCDACCHAWLSVSEVEAEQVQAGLAALDPEQRERVRFRGEQELARERELASEQEPSEPARCALLEDDGSCAIYAFRPLVCRTQGHALRYPAGFIPEQAVRLRGKSRSPEGVPGPTPSAAGEPATSEVTWCPLNYTAAAPRSEDVLDAERVDQILALIALRHAPSPEAAQARTSLSELAASR